MAVRRLKGLYLKSEGKYLEDNPSRYVEQTEALFEWRQNAPKQDIELHKRAEKFSGLFRDMLLDKDAIENVKLFEDDGKEVSFQPEILHCCCLDWVRFSVQPLKGNVKGCFKDFYNTELTIELPKKPKFECAPIYDKYAEVIISPKYADDDSVLLHEMIHLYEDVLDDFPMYYRDIVLWQLYKSMDAKIGDLDRRIAAFTRLDHQQGIDEVGGCHDILFLLKSYDLDLHMKYPLGKVLCYKVPGFSCEAVVEDTENP